MFGLVRRLVPCPVAAERVLEEVYVQVWQTARRFDPSRGAALLWIGTIARSRSADALCGTACPVDRNGDQSPHAECPRWDSNPD